VYISSYPPRRACRVALDRQIRLGRPPVGRRVAVAVVPRSGEAGGPRRRPGGRQVAGVDRPGRPAQPRRAAARRHPPGPAVRQPVPDRRRRRRGHGLAAAGGGGSRPRADHPGGRPGRPDATVPRRPAGAGGIGRRAGDRPGCDRPADGVFAAEGGGQPGPVRPPGARPTGRGGGADPLLSTPDPSLDEGFAGAGAVPGAGEHGHRGRGPDRPSTRRAPGRPGPAGAVGDQEQPRAAAAVARAAGPGRAAVPSGGGVDRAGGGDGGRGVPGVPPRCG
jgi:hypothetical protein